MKRYLFAFLLLASFSVYAAPVVYVVEGDLTLTFGSDAYGLDGAHFELVAQTNTNSTPSDIIEMGSGTTTLYNSESSVGDFQMSFVLTLTNRPGSAADSIIEGNFDSASTHNRSDLSQDEVSFPGGQYDLLGEFDGLRMPSVRLIFAGIYYPDGVPIPLPGDFSSSDLDTILMSSWQQGLGIYYETSNLTASGSLVPIPPAILLFPSALAGLAWFRRKA